MAMTLSDIRSSIDELDREIVALIARRQSWVVKAGELKRGEEDDAVRAPARVQSVVARVRELAADAGASPDVVEATYRAMISGFIDLELSVHAQAAAEPRG
jgi:isochorismate pyruvate lyase